MLTREERTYRGVEGAALRLSSRDIINGVQPSGWTMRSAGEFKTVKGKRMNETERAEEAIERGLARSRDEDWSGAAEAFRRAISLDSESVEARFRLGWALWNRSELDK